MHGLAGGEHPRSLAAHPVSEGFVLGDARLGLVEVLPGNAELAAVALEGEGEKLDSVGAADTALLLPTARMP